MRLLQLDSANEDKERSTGIPAADAAGMRYDGHSLTSLCVPWISNPSPGYPCIYDYTRGEHLWTLMVHGTGMETALCRSDASTHSDAADVPETVVGVRVIPIVLANMRRVGDVRVAF
jgi:hypothetical protein